MRAGKLDRTIAIEREAETVTPTGAVVTAWTTIATMRAEIVQQSTDEFLTGFGTAEEVAIVFRVRHFPGIAGSDRVVYAENSYNLVEMKEIGRNRGLELRCERVR